MRALFHPTRRNRVVARRPTSRLARMFQLTTEGEEQARELQPWLRTMEEFSCADQSAETRARRTSELVGTFGGGGRMTKPDLCEWDYGDYEGQRSRGYLRRRDNRAGTSFGTVVQGIEGVLDANLRARRSAHRSPSHTGRKHRTVLPRRVRARRGPRDGSERGCFEGQNFALGTASLSVLGYEPPHPETPVIALWNAAPRSLPSSRSNTLADCCF